MINYILDNLGISKREDLLFWANKTDASLNLLHQRLGHIEKELSKAQIEFKETSKEQDIQTDILARDLECFKARINAKKKK